MNKKTDGGLAAKHRP